MCGYQDKKTALESLSTNEWNSVYSDLLELYKTNKGYEIWEKDKKYLKVNSHGGTKELSASEAEITNKLNNKGITSIGFSDIGEMNAHMGGYMDDKLYLHVVGFNGENTPQVSMSWGEHPLKQKTLWQYNK